MKLLIPLFLFVFFSSLKTHSFESFPMYKPIHDEKFNPMKKIDYHINFTSLKVVEFLRDGRASGVPVRLVVYPDCFYVAKFSQKIEETLSQYCGAKIEGVKNKRYKNSGVDKNGYWDMRTTDDNPDNEVSFFFNFHLERDGDITFNLSRSMHANVFLFSCEQKFNSEDDGVAPNPTPVCTLEARGRKGLELEELYDKFSPKRYWEKLDVTSD